MKIRIRTRKRYFCAAYLHVAPVYPSGDLPAGLFGLVEFEDVMFDIVALSADRTGGFALTCCATGQTYRIDLSSGKAFCWTCGGKCAHSRGIDRLVKDGSLSPHTRRSPPPWKPLA